MLFLAYGESSGLQFYWTTELRRSGLKMWWAEDSNNKLIGSGLTIRACVCSAMARMKNEADQK
jgi:hypothetical protein